MMADQNFFEVQSLIEVQFNLNNETQHELLLIYYEALKAQDKKLAPDYLLEIADFEATNGNHQFALELISDLSEEYESKYFIKMYKIKIEIALSTGRLDELHGLVSDFLLAQYENKRPFIPSWLVSIIDKFFKTDFSLKLKKLSLCLLLQDLKMAEVITKELIISCFERSNAKGVNEKILLVGEVLKISKAKSILDIYQNFCLIYGNESKSPSDIKKIIEMCIYFDDYKFQVMLLSLLNKIGMESVVSESVEYVRFNSDYDYVYLDKFFPQLKRYFHTPIRDQGSAEKENPFLDLKISTKPSREIIFSDLELAPYQDEEQVIHFLKHQSYSFEQLCDLAVCFLQSEIPKVALIISERILDKSETDDGYLKGCYLKLSSLLMLRDYRAVIDTSFQALEKARSQNDILSFMYAQGEVYLRIADYDNAKRILSKIVSIDPHYRMAKERLERINEI